MSSHKHASGEAFENAFLIPTVFLVEYDADQMALLASFVVKEIMSLIDGDNITETQRQRLRKIQIVKISNAGTLAKAAKLYRRVPFVLLSGNLPTEEGMPAKDQFVKQGHRITGQHHCVDILRSSLPNALIMFTSNFNRFKRLITRYYFDMRDLKINFVAKQDETQIRASLRERLVEYYNISKNESDATDVVEVPGIEVINLDYAALN